MYFMEFFIIAAFIVGIFLYRNYKGDNVGKYIVKSTFSEDSGCTIGDCVKGLLML